MKKSLFYLLPVALCTVVFSCGGSNEGSGDNGKSGEGKSQTLHLTPIEQLNQGTAVVNSHAGATSRSSLKMNYRSYVEIGSNQTKVSAPVYPRVRKMANGEYVLFYHNNQIGADCYYLRSSDLKTWTGGETLFARYAITDSSNQSNERRFSNCNGIVLANGDVLAVASYRANKNYKLLSPDNGLVMRRSKDNGKSWSAPVEIYQGTNWEPHLLQLPSGEIQCYFTDAHPDILEHDSGTAMIVSTDNGQTWTPAFGQAPYKVLRKKWGELTGTPLFTFQMPAVIKLNNTNQLAAALETYDESGNYSISMAYSPDNGVWKHLSDTEEGSTDRQDDLFDGAGPSLAQFPSGETVLSYNQSSLFTLRIGDEKARTFGAIYTPFVSKGFWGTVEPIDAHQIIGAMHNTSGALMLARFYLNHGITASTRSVVVDGNNSEWKNTDEALFVGAKSQAQATLRCASDAANLYFLIEVLDSDISKADYATLYLSSANAGNTIGSDARRIKVAATGVKSTEAYAGGWQATNMGVTVKCAYDGTLSNNSNTDNGYLIEIAVPRSELNLTSGLLVNFSLYDTPSGEDALCSTASTSLANWIPVKGL